MYISLILLLPLISAAVCPAPAACNPLLPSTYALTAFTATRSQLDAYAKRSVESLLKYTNAPNGESKSGGGGFWTAQNGWMNVAAYDKIRGTKDFERQVRAAQDALAGSTGPGTPLVNEYNDEAGWAALANLRAYEAYGDKKYLDRTVAVWEYLNTQVVDQKAIDRGYLEGTKNPDATVQGECNGKSMIGGVYWVNGLPHHPARAASVGLNAVSTGLFSLLSAELCATTKDDKYCAKAYTSAQWLDRHMVRPDGLLWDNINGKDCKVTDWTFTYNAGLYIATYALLADLTANSTALGLAERTTKAAMISPGWHAPSGIIKEFSGPAPEGDGTGFKSVLVRGLYRSYPYFKDEGLKSAVLEYINIQYFGLTQLGSNSKTEPVEFGRNWVGPFDGSTAHAQLTALDVVNAISINPDSAFLKKERKGEVSKEVKRKGDCYKA